MNDSFCLDIDEHKAAEAFACSASRQFRSSDSSEGLYAFCFFV